MSQGSPLYTPLEAGNRAHARVRLNLPARLILFSGTENCVLLDLSSGGLKIMSHLSPKVGAMAVIECDDIEFFGTVVWVEGNRFGLRLDDPLAKDVVIAMRNAADAFPERAKRELLSEARNWVQGRA